MKEELIPKSLRQMQEKRGNIKNFGDKKADNFDKDDAAKVNPAFKKKMKKKKDKEESLMDEICRFIKEKRGNIKNFGDKKASNFDKADAKKLNKKKKKQESFITESRNSDEITLWIDNDEGLYDMKMDLFKRWNRKSMDPEFSIDRKRMINDLDGLIDAGAEAANLHRVSRNDRVDAVDEILDEYKTEYMDESVEVNEKSNSVTVMNLSTGEEQVFTGISPEDAVVTAYAQSRGDYNTWNYKKYRKQLKRDRKSIGIGDFAALKESTVVDEALNEITRGTPIDRVADQLVGYMKSEIIPRHTSESVAKVLDEAGFQLIDTRGGCDKWTKGEYTRLAKAMMQQSYRKMYSETNKEVWVGPSGDHIVYDILKIEAEVFNPDMKG